MWTYWTGGRTSTENVDGLLLETVNLKLVGWVGGQEETKVRGGLAHEDSS